MKWRFLVIAAGVLNAAAGFASDRRFSGESLPRFAALRSESVNARVGPGNNFPVRYVYRSRFQPVQIINEYYGWFQIRDLTGDISWVHRNQLTNARYVTPKASGVFLYRRARSDSDVLARIDRGVIFLADKCDRDFCHVKTNVDGVSYRGYLLRDGLWGI